MARQPGERLTILACSCAAQVLPQVRTALRNIDTHGPVVQVGDFTVILGGSPASIARHERQHARQAAERAPAWAHWLPLTVRARLGRRRFEIAYLNAHDGYGFLANPFEVEARGAEDPTTQTQRKGRRRR